MKIALLLMPICLCLGLARAQQSKTFAIEKLETKDGTLKVDPYGQILKNLLLTENGDHGLKLEDSAGFPFNIVARSKINDSLVYFGYHPFFNGMYEAYANHHPFTLSPDMVWLLIAQGFARHVNANADDLRSMFVDFKGKVSLVVRNDAIKLDDPDSQWEEVFPEFTKKIGEHTGQNLINTLTPDFTTTTPVDKIAAEITIMEAMKEYFEYIVVSYSCGIPTITIEGAPADWQKIIDKADELRKYKLEWWIDKIHPVLQQLKRASMGYCDTAFWRDMFKYHTLQKYGKPKIADGWIVKFFPYDKDGKPNNLQELHLNNVNLPDEIVKVDLKHILIRPDGSTKTTPLELWAGFMGLRQNAQTFGFRPVTGWMIRIKDTAHVIGGRALADEHPNEDDDILLRVETVPKEVLALKHIEDLEIHFTGKVLVPDEMANMEIVAFRIFGEITPAEIERVRRLLPHTQLEINGKHY